MSYMLLIKKENIALFFCWSTDWNTVQLKIFSAQILLLIHVYRCTREKTAGVNRSPVDRLGMSTALGNNRLEEDVRLTRMPLF